MISESVAHGTLPSPPPFEELVARSLAEDLGVDAGVFLGGPGAGEHLLARDVTTHAVVAPDGPFAGHVVAREVGIVCGLALAMRAWTMLAEAVAAPGGSPEIEIRPLVAEGSRVEAGTRVLSVRGPAHVVLAAERTALNALMTLSGIASETARWVADAGPVAICDTRKTIPGLRALSKWAAVCGGAYPHRAGLWDMVLIKDNHIRAAGGIAAAVAAARAGAPGLLVEVEADTVEQAAAAASAGADIVLLDNMAPDELSRAIRVVRERAAEADRTCLTEASGGIRRADLPGIVATGVDRVSTSALTLAPPLDFGFDEVVLG